MAPPKRKGGGRVTPKGGSTSGSLPTAGTPRVTTGPVHADASSARYTPPVPKAVRESPRWVPVLMLALLALGGLLIILNYLTVLPGAPDNLWLLAGLVLILGGILVATQWH